MTFRRGAVCFGSPAPAPPLGFESFQSPPGRRGRHLAESSIRGAGGAGAGSACICNKWAFSSSSSSGRSLGARPCSSRSSHSKSWGMLGGVGAGGLKEAARGSAGPGVAGVGRDPDAAPSALAVRASGASAPAAAPGRGTGSALQAAPGSATGSLGTGLVGVVAAEADDTRGNEKPALGEKGPGLPWVDVVGGAGTPGPPAETLGASPLSDREADRRHMLPAASADAGAGEGVRGSGEEVLAIEGRDAGKGNERGRGRERRAGGQQGWERIPSVPVSPALGVGRGLGGRNGVSSHATLDEGNTLSSQTTYLPGTRQTSQKRRIFQHHQLHYFAMLPRELFASWTMRATTPPLGIHLQHRTGLIAVAVVKSSCNSELCPISTTMDRVGLKNGPKRGFCGVFQYTQACVILTEQPRRGESVYQGFQQLSPLSRRPNPLSRGSNDPLSPHGKSFLQVPGTGRTSLPPTTP